MQRWWRWIQQQEGRLFYLIAIVLAFNILDLLFPLPEPPPYSTLVEAKDGRLLYAFLSPDDKWRMYTRLEDITPEMRKAILFKEDRWFYWHPGINPVAVVRALVNNTLHQRRTSGASTLTMQVARMLEPKSRTWTSKLMEMGRALQLEWHYSKRELLQLYLNLVPYGGNVEGIKSAAFLYFGKAPSTLSLAEVTALCLIPNRPNRLQLGKNNDYIREERNRWLRRFQAKALFPATDLRDALQEPLTAYRRPAPQLAPHFSLRLKKQYPSARILRSTLNFQLQRQLETMVTNYSQQLRQFDIRQIAVLVIDNRNHAVVAYIGSPDFRDAAIQGQVDGVKAIRSPGSTLKPLIYGLAFDQGLLTPRSILYDVPVSFQGYAPENYDEQYHGKVTCTDALAQSLNIPAVKTLDAIGLKSMLEALEKMGFRQMVKDKDKLGLSLALGGCGVSLEQLTGLYAMFATDGHYVSPSMLQQTGQRNKVQILSAEANYMVTRILSTLHRSDLPGGIDNVWNIPKIAWKTGTSYGRRDAWSIGFNKQFTVGVWCGNFDGKGVPELSGADIATPLLLQVFNTFAEPSKQDWFVRPKGVEYRKVCSESGNLPNTFCKNLVLAQYIPGVSPGKICEHQKKVWVNEPETVSYCTRCLPETGYKEAWYANIAPELLHYYVRSRTPYQKIPPHMATCVSVANASPPRILQPLDDKEYILNGAQSGELMLSVEAANDVVEVSWYVNNAFIRKAPKEEAVFIRPPDGTIKISCTDDQGRNSDVRVVVNNLSIKIN